VAPEPEAPAATALAVRSNLNSKAARQAWSQSPFEAAVTEQTQPVPSAANLNILPAGAMFSKRVEPAAPQLHSTQSDSDKPTRSPNAETKPPPRTVILPPLAATTVEPS